AVLARPRARPRVGAKRRAARRGGDRPRPSRRGRGCRGGRHGALRRRRRLRRGLSPGREGPSGVAEPGRLRPPYRGAGGRDKRPLRALGRLHGGRHVRPAARPLRHVPLRAALRGQAAAQGLPARGGAPVGAALARDAGVRGQRRGAAKGGGHRVCRPAPVRLRRPHPPRQLAGQRAAPGALGERVPRRAQRRRRPLPRHVRRGAPRGRLDARRGRARSLVARDRIPAAARPHRPRQLRRLPALAAPGLRARTALPDRRRTARYRGDRELRAQGSRRHSGANASAAGAGHRPHAAPRRAGRERAARPARARVRPGGRRDLAGAVRRGRAEPRAGRAGTPAVADDPRDGARALPPCGRLGGGVEGGRPARGGARRGGVVQKVREARARLGVAAVGAAVAVALAAYPVASSGHASLAVIGALGVLLAVVGALTGAALPLGAGLAALAVEYAVATGLEGSGVDTRADVWGAGLLLSAELLFLAGELRTSVLEGGDLVARRLGTIALLVAGSIVIGAVLLSAAGGRPGG